MPPSADELYLYLWRRARLTGGEQTRKRMVSMHSNDEGRTLSDQLWFTEVWIQLCVLLFADRRGEEVLPIVVDAATKEKGDIYVSRLDSFQYTDSYRIYVIHQTSLLARLAIRDLIRRYGTNRPYFTRTHPIPTSVFPMLRRVIRSMYHAKHVDEESRCSIPLTVETKPMYDKLIWLRDQRYRDLRVLCCWLRGIEQLRQGKVQSVVNSWAEGDNLFRITIMSTDGLGVQGYRDLVEVKFAEAIRRSMRIATALVRADAQDDDDVARWLRRRAIEHPLLGCSPDEAGPIAVEPHSDSDEEEDVPVADLWFDSSFVGNIECMKAEPIPRLDSPLPVYEKCGEDKAEGVNERKEALAELYL